MARSELIMLRWPLHKECKLDWAGLEHLCMCHLAMHGTKRPPHMPIFCSTRSGAQRLCCCFRGYKFCRISNKAIFDRNFRACYQNIIRLQPQVGCIMMKPKKRSMSHGLPPAPTSATTPIR